MDPLVQSHFFTFSPSFTSWRMASESLGLSCCFSAQASISALSSGEPRSPIIGVLPVRGRPGPRFFGLATIDLPIIWVLQKCKPGGSSNFRAREGLEGLLRAWAPCEVTPTCGRREQLTPHMASSGPAMSAQVRATVPCGRWKATRGSASSQAPSSQAPDLADVIKPAGSRRRVFLYVHFANCYPETSQSTANCTNCSFEPERYHRGTLSSFNHFPQLLVLVGLPTA